jgi:hypothetical protein
MAQVQERERVGSHSAKKRKTPLGWVPWVALLLFLALAALAWLLIANVTDENDEAGLDVSDDEVAAGAANADTGGADCPSASQVGEQIFTGIDGVVGCQVDVRVEVAEVADDNTFSITDGTTDVIVVDGSGGAVLDPGQRIRVVGEVRTFEFDEISEELELEKDESSYQQFEGKTVVIAESTTPA